MSHYVVAYLRRLDQLLCLFSLLLLRSLSCWPLLAGSQAIGYLFKGESVLLAVVAAVRAFSAIAVSPDPLVKAY